MEWLREAHAAEEQAKTMLSGFADRLQHPELKKRVKAHVKENERQAERVRECIERRDGSPSTIKVASAKLMVLGQALSGIFVGDEVLKRGNVIGAFEAMEINYKILISTAETVGDKKTAAVCGSARISKRSWANIFVLRKTRATAKH